MLGSELLEGENVYLTRPTPEDISVIAGWSHDTAYYRSLRRGISYPETAEEYEEWFRGMVREQSGYPFAIRRRGDQQLVGWLALREIFWQARHCTFVIGIDPALRGRGYGTDAVRVMLRYAFMELNLNRVELVVIQYNDAGIRAYGKAGFRYEGTQRAAVYRDGVYYDVVMMAMLRAEWETLYNQPPISYPSAAGAAPEAAPAPPAPGG